MNLSSSSTIKSILPALEKTFGEQIILPIIEEPITIQNNFFFVVCQNEVGNIGRNKIPL